MNNRALQIYVLNDNVSDAGKLRKYLKHRFGDFVKVSLFFNSSSCLRMIDNHVDLVVVDDYLSGVTNSAKSGLAVLKEIKTEHPQTEVVILSSEEDLGTKVEALRSGAKAFIPNKRGAFHRVQLIIDQVIAQPVRYLVAEYGVVTFVIVFFLVWGLLGVIAWIALRLWNKDLV